MMRCVKTTRALPTVRITMLNTTESVKKGVNKTRVRSSGLLLFRHVFNAYTRMKLKTRSRALAMAVGDYPLISTRYVRPWRRVRVWL